jgi:hypothetical protein
MPTSALPIADSMAVSIDAALILDGLSTSVLLVSDAHTIL